MEQFMRKYSFWLTSLLGVVALIILVVGWNQIDMLRKLPIMYIVALALHEAEELKLPGGFIELVTDMTGLQLKNLGMAKLGLFLFTLYATVLPVFLAGWVWPVMSTLFIGIVEIIMHLAAARINKERFYSPGLITAVFVQFPVAVYGYYYLYSNGLVRGIYWLWAILLLIVPLLLIQRAIVVTSGLSYREFMNDARKSLFSKQK
ncbi:MAG: HXXEE domain-containing protein [Clostridiales bacterium]|nr:HXXEE domain-containing protein [Clostridiales bacterium]MCD8125909.1 HXXEE domain-containing protein [Clostridiales bacterium]